MYKGEAKGRRKTPKKGIRVEHDGRMFDSILERDFYVALKRSSRVLSVDTHKPLRFYGTTRALELDFVIERDDGIIFYADTKAFWTISKTFIFKKQILEQQMGIHIDIVLRNRESKNRDAVDEIPLYIQYLETTDKNIGFNRWKALKGMV